MVLTQPGVASGAATGQGVPPRRIYAVTGVPPEIQAYALAKYSRSAQGMLESIRELSQQKAESFLDTFYFQYGHRSIADLAHLAFGLEQISILAAVEVVDEPVWDGQERSTRYQPFRKTGWHRPAEQAADVVRETSPLAADYLLPLAYRMRCLFKMDWAEAAYIIEQRTQPQGHFSYRRIAWGMYEALRASYPRLAAPIRATDPNGPLDLLRR